MTESEIAADALLAGLDPEQREVVLATRGAVCVLAGAGTGKTRAITHRIAYAAAIGIVNPAHVLALTFTVRAHLGRAELADPAARTVKVRASTCAGLTIPMAGPAPPARRGPGARVHVPRRRAAPAQLLLAASGRRPAAAAHRRQGDPDPGGGQTGQGPAGRPRAGRRGQRDRVGQDDPDPPGFLLRRRCGRGPDARGRPGGHGAGLRRLRTPAARAAPDRLRVGPRADRRHRARAPRRGRPGTRHVPVLRGRRVPGREPAAEAAARRLAR